MFEVQELSSCRDFQDAHVRDLYGVMIKLNVSMTTNRISEVKRQISKRFGHSITPLTLTGDTHA